jgi:hypothetical protein
MRAITIFSTIAIILAVGFETMAYSVNSQTEGYVIRTTTDIEATGTVEESARFKSTYFEGGPAGGNPEAIGVLANGFSRGAEVAYEFDFKAIDGQTRFLKDFDANFYDTPNLEVDSIFTYLADQNSLAAIASYEEKVGVSYIDAGDSALNFAGLLSLCPWVSSSSYPAKNVSIAAGVSLKSGSSDPVPIPGAFWLLGSALIGILGLRKRFADKSKI